MCFGGKTTINSRITGGAGNYKIEWQNSTGQILSVMDSLHVEHHNKNTFGIQNYLHITEDGCSKRDSNSFQILFLKPLELKLEIADSCLKSGSIVTAVSSGGLPDNYRIEWYRDGNFEDTGFTLNIPIPVKETLYSAVLTDGCSLPSDTAKKWISPYPDVQLSLTPYTGCELLDVKHLVTPVNQTRNQYWYFAGSSGSNWVKDSIYLKSYPAGNYRPWIIVRSMTGCTDTFEFDSVWVYPKPKAQFHSVPSRPTPNLPVVNFVNQSSGAVKYHWDFGTFGNSTLFEPSVPFNVLGTHPVKLVAISDKGCMDSIQGEVKVYDDFYIHVPGAFTPGSNGLNDVFEPVITSYKSYTLRVYNRWGQLLFKGDTRGWDGKYKGETVPEGKYAYALDIVTLADVLVLDRGVVIVLKEK